MDIVIHNDLMLRRPACHGNTGVAILARRRVGGHNAVPAHFVADHDVFVRAAHPEAEAGPVSLVVIPIVAAHTAFHRVIVGKIGIVAFKHVVLRAHAVQGAHKDTVTAVGKVVVFHIVVVGSRFDQ